MSSASDRRRWNAGSILLVAGVVAGVFSGALGHSFVNWDDDIFVLHPHVEHWLDTSWWTRISTPHVGYAVPIPTALYAILHQLFGEDRVWIFKAVNIAAHAANAALVLVLLRRMKVSMFASVAAALLWAIHPVMVEPVVWATGLKDVLSMTGILLAILGVVGTGDDEVRVRDWLLVSLGPIIAIGSKPTGVVVGPLLVVVALILLDRDSVRRMWAWIVGGGWTAVGFAVAAVSAVTHGEHGGQDLSAFSLGRIFSALETALRNYVIPLNLSPRYLFAPPTATTYALGVGLIALGVVLLWRTYREHPLIACGICWTAIAFAPVSNLIPINRFHSDSYLYTPSLGLVLVVAGLASAVTPARPSRAIRRAGVIAGLLLLALLTVVQTSHWEDDVSLWKRAVDVTPHDPLGYEKLGEAYFLQERFGEAVRTFEYLNETFPGHRIRTPDWPMSYCVMGAFEQCEQRLVAMIEQGPVGSSARAEVLWRHLLITYALYCVRRDCQIEEVVPTTDHEVVYEAKELLEKGMTMEEINEQLYLE